MSLLIPSKEQAIKFVKDRIDLQADTIEVEANGNGTYAGTATFNGPPADPPPSNAAEAKSDAEAAINVDGTKKVTVTKQSGGTYDVAVV